MKIILIGCKGRMGQEMSHLLSQRGVEFLGIDKDDRDKVAPFDADVIVDFSSYLCLKENLSLALERQIPIVIATTNHNEENMRQIDRAKEMIPIFMASNFSILFNLMLKMLKNIKKSENFDIFIQETHHKHKKDSPSGSCKDILKILGNYENVVVDCRRAGEIVGQHKVQIINGNESLTICHDALNRQTFCEGALQACWFILTKKNGLYGMDDMLSETI